MGKAKKIKKKIQETREAKLAPERQAKREELEAGIRQNMDVGQYAEVLEALAELVQMKDVKPEFMYDGAYSYFMLGDYERAVAWVNNVLKYDVNHVQARILLARICVLEDRVDDGLAVFEFVLKHSESSLAENDREEIEDMVSYYYRKDTEKVRQKYPNIAKFMEHGENSPEDNKTQESQPIQEGSPKAALQALRDKVVGGNRQSSGSVVSRPEKTSGVPAAAEGSSAREILQTLRDKAAGGSGQEEARPQQKTESSQMKETGDQAASNARSVLQALRDRVLKSGHEEKQSSGEVPEQETHAEPQEAGKTQQEALPSGHGDDIRQKKQMVMEQNISLEEKVRVLNAYAGSYYYQRNLEGAKELLMEAMNVDSSNLMTLTNLAYVLVEQGEKEKALELVTRSKLTDFALIRLLRDA